MLNKIKNYQKGLKSLITRFGDIRFSGQVVFVIIVILITWSGVRTIQSNYSLQQQVSELKQQNQVIELENSNIALQNNYYNSNQYQQLSARQNFGLAEPGETELRVPNAVAMNYTVNPPNYGVQTVSSPKTSSSNFQAWTDFFLHRSSAN